MLVDINLLPEKESKSRLPLYMIAGILCLSLIFVTVLIIETKSQDNLAASADSQTKQVNSLDMSLQQSLNQYESNDSVAQLQAAVKWASSNPVKTLPVIKKLIGFLPDRGFFQSFTLNEDHTINLSIQFDTETDAAYYLSRLSNSSWFPGAKLLSLKAQDLTSETNSASGMNSTQTGSQTSTDPEAKDVLPRYLAEYQITLDPSAIKAGETKKVEGGANP